MDTDTDTEMSRSYKRAVELTKERVRLRRSSVAGKPIADIRPMPSMDGEAHLTGTPSIHGMRGWLDELGHSAEAINQLNVIHVAGTKGKGSTCAFIESFLRTHGKNTGFPRKTGLYTSPHLIYPEERIRINFEPLSRELFAKYFFEVEDILSQGPDTRPRYLQLYALLAFHAFIREGVDVAIIETHHGGEYDSTNFVEKPKVTCVTTLGLDHVQQLGSTIESIAWHKAGIFKPGARAVSAPQVPGAADMLRTRAIEKEVNLEFAPQNPTLPPQAMQVKPDVLRTNCSVALNAVNAFLQQTADQGSSPLSSSEIVQGIRQWSWPGRFQIEIEGENQWYLDGAHNNISVNKAAEWFIENMEPGRSASQPVRILIFAQITKVRDGATVVECLANALAGGGVQHVIFTTYRREKGTPPTRSELPPVDVPKLHTVYAETWKKINPNTTVSITMSIEEALEIARNLGNGHGGIRTLITGSQHLVGPALSLIRPDPAAH